MKRIGLFFGGMGNEAEVSLISASNVITNIDNDKYELVLIYRDKDGTFYHIQDISQHTSPQEHQRILPNQFKDILDSVLPMTHGKYGEDGVLQGIFEMQHIPYSGCRVLGSALCMDKIVCKNFLAGQDIPQVAYRYQDTQGMSPEEIDLRCQSIQHMKLPVYIKPANSGSSVGISKVDNREDLLPAIHEAAKHDTKILVEEGLSHPREIELAIIGNTKLTVSTPGELSLSHDFYSFDAKYKLGETIVHIPAQLSPEEIQQIQDIARKAYTLCDCKGFARIDFFISEGKIYLNEINTLPGFTDISMFPMLMKHSGMSYKELISTLIELAY